jgi:hypothetical protein
VSEGEISKAMELKYMDKAVVDSEVSRYLIHPQLIDDGKDPIPNSLVETCSWTIPKHL